MSLYIFSYFSSLSHVLYLFPRLYISFCISPSSWSYFFQLFLSYRIVHSLDKLLAYIFFLLYIHLVGAEETPRSSKDDPIMTEQAVSVKQESDLTKKRALESPSPQSPPSLPVDSNSKRPNNAPSVPVPEKKQKSNGLVVVPATKPQLFYSNLKTGIAYDVRMRYHAKIFTSYFEYIDPHPEDPRRIYRIYKILAEAGLIQDLTLAGSDDIGPLMVKIPVREATAEEILQVHTEEHLKYIELTEAMSREKLLEETEKGDSIYVNNDSYLSAKLSCGGTIEACKAVVEGKVKNLLAIVRPPGHHAEPDTPGGFCLFLNVAVAAKNILKSYPETVRKIAIIDWDIHHGNGTQKSFYNDPRVLYISLHRYDNGKYYPGTKYGNSDQTGEGEGEGTSVNIPWRSGGMHDGDYFYAFNKVVIPILAEFNPDLLIVLSGFDAADGDIIGGCHVSPAGYGHMAHMLKLLQRGKLCVVLEGGYNLDSISKSALAVAKVLVGEPPESTISFQPQPAAIEVIDEVMKVQLKYWKCMSHGTVKHTFDDIYDLPDNAPMPFTLTNLADPIRAHQALELYNRHQFISIPIVALVPDSSNNNAVNFFTTDLPSHLEHVLLASPDVHNSNTLVISIHDPAEIWANVNPINGIVESNSLVVLDHPLFNLINKITKEVQDSEESSVGKLGFIDINIPPYPLLVSSLLKSSPSDSSPSNYNPQIFAQELLLYIWDNYVTYFSNLEKVVFVGFGDAYQAIVHLYAKRPLQDIKEVVKGTVVFLNQSPLKALVPVMDELMVEWYYQNSVIFTSHSNPCWAGESNGVVVGANGGDHQHNEDHFKRPRRKFGRVLRAKVDGLWEVVAERFDEGIDFVLDSVEDLSESSS